MTTFEKHLIHRLRNCLAYRNAERIDSRIYNRQEAKRLIKSIRFERDGTNDRLAETYRQRALAFARCDFAALR
jgi:hypothetical protein